MATAWLTTGLSWRSPRLTLYDLRRGQVTPRPIGPIGSILVLIAPPVTGPSPATPTKRSTLPDGATTKEDGSETGSTRELTPSPALIAPLLNSVAVAETDGRQDTVPVPAPDGPSPLIANGGSPS